MKIWSVQQAAKEMGISEQRVRKLLSEGRIKGRKLDGTWIVTSLKYKRKHNYPKKVR
jgi:excisionase family DNA binding protein